MKKGPMEMTIDKVHVGNVLADAYKVLAELPPARSGVQLPTPVSEAERELVLKANAMLTLADMVEIKRLDAVGPNARITFTLRELDLICYALRHTADSDN